MKRIVTWLAVYLVVLPMFGVGVAPCSGQAGLREAPAPVAGPALPGGQGEMVVTPASPGYAGNVWIEAILVEMDRAITGEFEEMVGFKLSPPDGKAILSAAEKEKILAAVKEIEEARVVVSLCVLTISGQQTQTEHVEEITFPTEYECKEGTIIPGNWEKRDVGAILNVTPVVGEDGLVTLVMMPEFTVLSKWLEIDGTDVTQPVFKTWNMTTTVHIPDGSSFVLKEAPFVSLHGSQASEPEEALDPENQTTHLLIVSAKAIPVK